MTKEFIRNRITELRIKKGVSEYILITMAKRLNEK